jgi:hypothetical protein
MWRAGAWHEVGAKADQYLQRRITDNIRRCPKTSHWVKASGGPPGCGFHCRFGRIASNDSASDLHVRFVRCNACGLDTGFWWAAARLFDDSMWIEYGRSFDEAWWIDVARCGPTLRLVCLAPCSFLPALYNTVFARAAGEFIPVGWDHCPVQAGLCLVGTMVPTYRW